MTTPITPRIRVGMIGGGASSNIGETHRRALRLDGRFELVAGVFSRDLEASRKLGFENNIEPHRIYADYQEMLKVEKQLENGIELVVVATPDKSHFEISKAFLEAGISVACEKPLTQFSSEARELNEIALNNKLVLAVAHAYTSYAMVRHAAHLVRTGEIGELRFIDVEHASGWAATRLEDDGNPTVVWRMDPEQSMYASVAADLGTHAYHLMRYISGQDADEISAELRTLVPGRKVADNMTASLRFESGLTGRIWATMAATGHNHGLRIRVYGSKASIEWQHEEPHHLLVKNLDGTYETLTAGMSSLSAAAHHFNRTGLGHPEGFIEAFANYYSDIADDIQQIREKKYPQNRVFSYPNGFDGIAGVELVEAVVASDSENSIWIPISKPNKKEK